MPGRRSITSRREIRNPIYPSMRQFQRPERHIANPKRKLWKAALGISFVLALTVPVFRSGLRDDLTFWEWIINHTIWGPPVEYIPEEYYMGFFDGTGDKSADYSINRIRSLEEMKIPTGQRDFGCRLTDQITTIKMDSPWIAFTLRNKGPGDVYCCVNDRQNLMDAEAITPGKTYELNLEYPMIHTIYTKAAVGTTSNIRISAITGRKY